ncbi:hypothetical protein RKD24_000857 [Streptomyces calvus]
MAQRVQAVEAVRPSRRPSEIDGTVTSAPAPPLPATPTRFTFSATRAGSAHCPVDRIVGMNPA